MTAERFDAVVVGAGPNGLAAAVVLARAGLAVQVHEAASTVGGGTRTEELTLPGFRHDVCSAIHPLGGGSPLFRDLPLARHGLEWIEPPVALAHPSDRGGAAILERSVEATAASLGADARMYRRLVAPFLGRWDELAPMVLGPMLAGWPRHPLLLARFGARALLPASALLATLRHDPARRLMAGLAAHAIVPLRTPATTGVALLFAVAAHGAGWPLPRGGSQAIADALAGYLGELGAEVVTDHPVESLDELPPARAYLLDVMPRDLVRLAGRRLPERYVARLGRYRHGAAVFKLDYALDGPVPWTEPDAHRAGTVHLGAPGAVVDQALRSVRRGSPPDPPFVIVAQPSRFDPSRAPAGKHTLWAYAHVPNGWTGDLTDAVEAQIQRFAPGFRDLVLARVAAGPGEIEGRNPNNIGGDIAGGAFRGRQTVFRPVVSAVPYATPDRSIYLCSAATPPGAGVHGMCGYHAAQTVLGRVFGRPDASRSL